MRIARENPDAPPPQDADDFKLELEASLADFDINTALQADHRPKPISPAAIRDAAGLPVLQIDSAPSTPKQAAATPQFDFSDFSLPGSPAPATGGADLLSELRRQAAQQSATQSTAAEVTQAKIRATDQALRKLFKYLVEYCRHLDTLKPATTRSHRPLPGVELSGLCWTESHVDFRTSGGTEASPYDVVMLRYTLSNGRSVVLEKLPHVTATFHDELKRHGLMYQARDVRSPKGLTSHTEFEIPLEIKVSLLFKAEPEQGVIHLRTRNLVELKSENYNVTTDSLDATWLNELGKFILERPNMLFASLRPQ